MTVRAEGRRIVCRSCKYLIVCFCHQVRKNRPAVGGRQRRRIGDPRTDLNRHNVARIVSVRQSKIDKTDVALAVVRHHADIENGSDAAELVQIDNLIIRERIIGRQRHVQSGDRRAFRARIRRAERRNPVLFCLFAIIHFALSRTYAPCIKIFFRHGGRFFALPVSKSDAERCRQRRKEKNKQAQNYNNSFFCKRGLHYSLTPPIVRFPSISFFENAQKSTNTGINTIIAPANLCGVLVISGLLDRLNS